MPDWHEADKADRKADIDAGERVSSMEPLVLSEHSRHRPALSDLAVDLVAASAGFGRSLPPGVMQALAHLVRAMNCYYSNLIEGHDTHPVDIERALRDDYSTDIRKRNLQLEARAHVIVQRWIDEGGLRGKAMSVAALLEIHRRFGALLPHDLLRVENPESGEVLEVVPGDIRPRYVKVGSHVPVSPGAVPRFLARFEEVYSRLGRAETILAAAAAHHRLLWIHPFLDGNGRVARLMSHAVLLEALETGGAWSVARGLARAQADYRAHLVHCDTPRRNDLDGRGHLSEEALAAFTRFFLETCLDQVRFMESLVQPARLRDRVLHWAGEEVRAGALPARCPRLLEAVLHRGQLPRAEIPSLLDTSERNARRAVSALVDRGVLQTESTRAPLTLAFPTSLAARWLPGLFPEKPVD
jgi:Fic family protein